MSVFVVYDSVFVVYDDVMANRVNRDGILAIVVTHLIAITSDFDVFGITRGHTDFHIDATFATSMLVAGVGNLNDRGDGTRGDVANAAILDIFVNVNGGPNDRPLRVSHLRRVHRIGTVHWLLNWCRINRIGSWRQLGWHGNATDLSR